MTINTLTSGLSILSNTASTPANALPSQINNNVAIAAVTAQPVLPVQSTQAAKTDSIDQVQQAVEKIKSVTDQLAQNLQFSIDDETGITVVKILDSQTQEVIRQIPTEEAVSIARTLDKVQGLLFNDKA